MFCPSVPLVTDFMTNDWSTINFVNNGDDKQSKTLTNRQGGSVGVGNEGNASGSDGSNWRIS